MHIINRQRAKGSVDIQEIAWNGLEGKALVKEATPKVGVDELTALAARASKGMRAVQMFDPNAIASRTHVLGAYLNALASFRSRAGRSNSIAMEMLLSAALTDQIGLAIKRAGARPGARVLVFATDSASLAKVLPALKDVREFKPNKRHEARVLRSLGLDDKEDARVSIMRAMAMSRLRA